MTTMVVPTEGLEQVAKLKPITIKQLGDVPEFGPTRAERYGEPHWRACAHLDAIEAAGGGREEAAGPRRLQQQR